MGTLCPRLLPSFGKKSYSGGAMGSPHSSCATLGKLFNLSLTFLPLGFLNL